jgi:hypothetical protein
LEQVPEDAFDQFVLNAQDAKELYKSPSAAMANLLLPLSFYFCQLTQQCLYDDFGLPLTNRHGVPILFKVDDSGQFILDKKGNPIPVPDGQVRFPALPDPVAAIYTLNANLGMSQSALVKVLAGETMPTYVRGQSIIGLSFAERLSMIVGDQQLNDLIDQLAFSDPDEFFIQLLLIVSSDPDNATVVTDVAARRMINRFLRFVTASEGAGEGASVTIDGVEDAADNAANDGEKLLLPMLGD